MEPFGLLNLLKSLLPQAENPTQNPKENLEKNGNDLDNGAATPKVDNDRTQKKEKSPPDFAEEPQNAFLDFVNRHDERKKHIKKP